jgi:hypothetical protein
MRKTTNTIGQWECHRFLCGPLGISILLRGYKFFFRPRGASVVRKERESSAYRTLDRGPAPQAEWRGAPAWRPKRRGCVAPSICLMKCPRAQRPGRLRNLYGGRHPRRRDSGAMRVSRTRHKARCAISPPSRGPGFPFTISRRLTALENSTPCGQSRTSSRRAHGVEEACDVRLQPLGLLRQPAG